MVQVKHIEEVFTSIEGIYEDIHSIYPEKSVEIISASYEDNLCLGRHKKALLMDEEKSEVLYVVTKNYSISYRYRDSNGNKGERTIVVPEGLCTDLASVPDFLRSSYPRVGRYLEGAIVHDFLYVAWQLFEGGEPTYRYRSFADSLLLALWQKADVSCFTRNGFYAGIRLGGWVSFGGREPHDELVYEDDICSFNDEPVETYTGTVYPPKGCKIADADYISNLCVGRFKKSLLLDNSESLYVVASDYTVEYTYKNKDGEKKDLVTVPAGFCTALSALPRSEWSQFHRVGKHLEAAIVHDFLYVEWQLQNRQADDAHRIFANDLFFKLMEKAEVDEDVRDRFESVVNSSECIDKFRRGRKNGNILVDNPCVSELQTGDKN